MSDWSKWTPPQRPRPLTVPSPEENMTIATTLARRETKANPTAAAAARDLSIMAALQRIEAKQQDLLERVGRMGAMLDDVTELLTRPSAATSAAQPALEPAAAAMPAAAPAAEAPLEPPADRGKGWVNPAIAGMRSATVVQSVARRVAGMAIGGGYQPAILSSMYVSSKDATPATDEQVAEMVERDPENWQDLGALADKLTVRGGWSPSAVGSLLALLAWRDAVYDDATVALVGRLVRPVGGKKAEAEILRREFERALDVLGAGPGQIRDALHFWAGDFDWAHPSVRDAA